MPAREKPSSNVSLNIDHSGWRDIVDPVIGLRIRGLREQTGAEVGVIARSQGLRVKALKAIESGEESADSAALHCFASMLLAPITFVFDGLPAVTYAATTPDAAAQPNQAPRARELVKILNIYACLPDKRLCKTLMELNGSVVQAKP